MLPKAEKVFPLAFFFIFTHSHCQIFRHHHGFFGNVLFMRAAPNFSLNHCDDANVGEEKFLLQSITRRRSPSLGTGLSLSGGESLFSYWRFREPGVMAFLVNRSRSPAFNSRQPVDTLLFTKL